VALHYDPETKRILKHTSSVRYKTNLGPFSGDIQKTLLLEPKSFTYKGSDVRGVGYLAENLEALGLKKLVIYDAQGRSDSIRYHLLPVYQNTLLKQLKEEYQTLKEQLKAHAQTIEQLQKDILALPRQREEAMT